MAESMEGVVTEVQQPNPENVEEKTVAGESTYTWHRIQHASFHLPMRLRWTATTAWSHVSGCDAPMRLSVVLGY